MKPIDLELVAQLVAAKSLIELDSTLNHVGGASLSLMFPEDAEHLIALADSALDYEVVEGGSVFQLAGAGPTWLVVKRLKLMIHYTYLSEQAMIQLTAIARGAYGVMPPTNG